VKQHQSTNENEFALGRMQWSEVKWGIEIGMIKDFTTLTLFFGSTH
jgi:hypothetical protein